MDAIAAQVIASVLSSNLVKETVTGAGKLILESGKKLSKKVTDYMEKAEKGEIHDDEVPADVQAEIKGSLKDILKETSEPVYSGGVAMFVDGKLTEEKKEYLSQIFCVNNDDMEIEWELSDEEEKYLEIVKNFIADYYGTDVRANENDYEIYDDVIFLNFGFYDDEDYYRVYKPDRIRELINALNHLLIEQDGDRDITRFTIY